MLATSKFCVQALEAEPFDDVARQRLIFDERLQWFKTLRVLEGLHSKAFKTQGAAGSQQLRVQAPDTRP